MNIRPDAEIYPKMIALQHRFLFTLFEFDRRFRHMNSYTIDKPPDWRRRSTSTFIVLNGHHRWSGCGGSGHRDVHLYWPISAHFLLYIWGPWLCPPTKFHYINIIKLLLTWFCNNNSTAMVFTVHDDESGHNRGFAINSIHNMRPPRQNNTCMTILIVILLLLTNNFVW